MKAVWTPAMAKPLFAFFFLLFASCSFAQCLSTGAQSGSVFSDDNINNAGSIAFHSAGDAIASDGNTASATAVASLFSGKTHYLKATGFGFAIPVTASICGILVEVQKSATGINLLTSVKDNSVLMLKGGSLTLINHAKSAKWSSTPGYSSYGGATDTWGTSWSPSDINSPGFGVAFSAQIKGLVAVLPGAHIDHIRITVYYITIVLPLQLEEFTAIPDNDRIVRLKWTLYENEAKDVINIQRRTTSEDWVTIYSQKTSSAVNTYTYTDTSCHESQAYYRLQLQQATGSYTYSKTIPVRWKKRMLNIYPNPARDELFVQQYDMSKAIQCVGADGRHWPLKTEHLANRLLKINIRHLPAGCYILLLDDKKGVFIKN